MNMYELFILGKLMHRPMHGYLLQSIMNAALGPFRRVSWGTLYPLLRKLEQDGLIAVQTSKSNDRRGTKNYRTTSLGRTRFLEIMRATGDRDGDYRDLFRVKLSNFGHIGKEDQQAIIADYRAFLAAVVTHSDAMSREVVNAPGLAVAERPYVLKAIDHQRHLAASEITWLDRLSRDLEERDWGEKDVHKAEKPRTTAAKLAGKHNDRAGARSRSKPR
jgi:DNA-binding PadR family transcriptional regulator